MTRDQAWTKERFNPFQSRDPGPGPNRSSGRYFNHEHRSVTDRCGVSVSSAPGLDESRPYVPGRRGTPPRTTGPRFRFGKDLPRQEKIEQTACALDASDFAPYVWPACVCHRMSHCSAAVKFIQQRPHSAVDGVSLPAGALTLCSFMELSEKRRFSKSRTRVSYDQF
jgi:hypothetical protein